MCVRNYIYNFDLAWRDGERGEGTNGEEEERE